MNSLLDKVKIHRLDNTATVIGVSNHGFKFSDGTECGPQDKDVVNALNLKRSFTAMPYIAGMKCNRMTMFLYKEQEELLTALSNMADLVILPLPVLLALRESGIRDQYPNCVAFNATPDTMRSAPDEKIVDINNWSY